MPKHRIYFSSHRGGLLHKNHMQITNRGLKLLTRNPIRHMLDFVLFRSSCHLLLSSDKILPETRKPTPVQFCLSFGQFSATQSSSGPSDGSVHSGTCGPPLAEHALLIGLCPCHPGNNVLVGANGVLDDRQKHRAIFLASQT